MNCEEEGLIQRTCLTSGLQCFVGHSEVKNGSKITKLVYNMIRSIRFI